VIDRGVAEATGEACEGLSELGRSKDLDIAVERPMVAARADPFQEPRTRRQVPGLSLPARRPTYT